MTSPPLTCWTLSDGRRGIDNQALGLAEACARLRLTDVESYTIEHSSVFKAARPRLQFALRSRPKDYDLPSFLPDIVIGCGRQAIAPLMAIKKQAGASVFTLYIQDPRMETDLFDLVVCPEHDGLNGPNVETMIGAPHRVTRDRLITETLAFETKLLQYPMPRTAMMIGGKSKTHTLSPAIHAQHVSHAKTCLEDGQSLLISTSRRTPDWVVKEYHDLAAKHDNIWLYTGQSETEGDNPYFAFLGGADTICVTEDSTNMLTEACATGKPVFRLPMEGQAGKFQHLYDQLEQVCGVTRVSASAHSDDYTPLTETDRIAERVWAHFDARSASLN